jgi:hypothetical protein
MPSCGVDRHRAKRATRLDREPKRVASAARALRLWLAACAIAALALITSVAAADAPRRIPVIFHVAQRDGEAVAPASFITEQLAAANRIYGPLGIELVEIERAPLGPQHAEQVTRTDRDALAPYVRNGAIHVFIVAKLMDVDEPGRERRGVHWHPRRKPRISFLIVSQISGPYVLAHELGHFFGNREHSQVPGNLMCYQRGEGEPFLDEAQVRKVLETLKAMLKAGRLVVVK